MLCFDIFTMKMLRMDIFKNSENVHSEHFESFINSISVNRLCHHKTRIRSICIKAKNIDGVLTMIRKTFRKSSQDKTVYSVSYVPSKRSPNLIIYGNAETPFLVAEDVVKWLDLALPYQDILSVIDDSERMVKLIMGDTGKPVSKWCVTESGAYHIIEQFYVHDDKTRHRLSNELREGLEKFLVWVMTDQSETTEDKATSQRYTVNEIMENPDILIDALNRLKDEQKKNRQLTAELTVQSEKIAELEPKAEYYDKILNTANGVSLSVIAKEYGKSAMWLNKLLHSLKIQYKQGETWVLYSRYVDKGYTCTKTHQCIDEYGVTRSVMHTYWTQAGRKFIYDTLKKRGIEPIA